MLLQLQALDDVKTQLSAAEKQLEVLKQQRKKAERDEEEATQRESAKELLLHEISLIKARMDQSSFAQINAQVEEMEKQLETMNAAVGTCIFCDLSLTFYILSYFSFHVTCWHNYN